MARIVMRMWVCLAMGVALAALFGPLGEAPVAAQSRPTRAHQALTRGIEFARRGEYDHALNFFEQAKAGMEDLSPTEQRELLSEMEKVQSALKARQEGTAKLQKAEEALQANRTQEGLALLKELSGNQYLRPEDKKKVQQLSEQIQPQNAGAPAPRPGTNPNNNSQALVQARGKLRQARVFLSKENYDAADVLAREAQALGASYAPGEDTPERLLDEVSRARVAKMGCKELMTAARTALDRGDLEKAEQLAQDAKKAESFWSVRLWGDTPAKVIKDVQTARARQVAQAKITRPAVLPKDQPSPNEKIKSETPKAEETAKAKVEQPKGVDPSKMKDPPPVVAEVPAPTGNDTDDARAMVRQGRKCLDEGRPDEALDLGRRAARLNAAFHWWDVDNPSKLMADAHKARAAQPKGKTESQPSTVAKAETQPAAAKIDAGKPEPIERTAAVTKTKTELVIPKDPRAQLKAARQMLSEGKLDEAHELCQKAQTSGISWGLFEDTPNKLMGEITKAQAKRDKDESIKVLDEARKLYADGKLDDAEKLTYRAERLHGTYSVWDFGERPAKLRGEIEVARAKVRRTVVPPVPEAIVQRDLDPTPIQKTSIEKTVPVDRPTVASEQRPAAGNEPASEPTSVATSHPITQPSTERRTMVSTPPDRRDPDQSPASSPLAGGPARPVASNTSPLSGGQSESASPFSGGAPASPLATNSKPEPTVSVEKQHALQLLAAARKEVEQGRLLEARQKAIDAQKMGLSFNLDEETPERVLLELSAQCNRKVDNLMQSATDAAVGSGRDAAKFQKAEQDLAAARQLASGFGQDTQNIDNKIAWLKSLQSVANTVTPAVQPPNVLNEPRVAPVQHQEASRGQELLERARLELKKGELAISRRLAEEAFSGPYGVQKEAAGVLATLDAEEENQRIITANRSFELMYEAYRQKNFEKVKILAKSIDQARLSPDNKTRMKDVMLTPQLQESVAGNLPQAAPGSGVVTVDDRGVKQPGTSGKTLQESVQISQEILLQKWRGESARARSEATRVFNTAPNRAVEILQSLKSQLDASGLEADYIALLKRQVDSQLQQFQTLKAQTEFRDLQNQQATNALDRHKRGEMAEMEKNKQVQDLLRQYNTFRKQGKYQEAYTMAMKAREIDPDNPVVDTALYTVRILENQSKSDQAKSERQQMNLDGLRENFGPSVTPEDPLSFNKDRWNKIKGRGLKDGIESPRSPKERKIEERMSQPINIEFRDGTPLNQVVEDLRALSGLNIVVDTGALTHEGIDPKQSMSVEPLEGIALKSALNIILSKATPTKLTWIIQDEVLKITTEREARGKLVQKTYTVGDVIIPIDNYIVPPTASLMHQMGRSNENRVQMGATTFTGPNSLQGGSPTGTSSNGTSMGSMAEQQPNQITGNPVASTRSPGQTNTMEEMLIKLITNTIQPNTWAAVGGPGTIEYYPLGMALVINQTPDIQEQVNDLLNALRRLQDLEVSVEVRMISLEESFFERIGLDFQVNIDPKVPPRVQEQIVTQQFAPINQINYPRFQNVIAGLQPAASGGSLQGLNALTSDLHIPINNSSFRYAIPPFGGFPNIPGANGGLSMGLAFLSDIQVFMFMEAAQGDRRTNVMQAPKLTLFNGQTATIQIQDFQWFVTNVQVVQASGQVVFVPQNQPIPLGVNLAVQAVVSADRRFVRLNLAPTLTNLASATVPLFPITTFITPVFEGGAQGQPVPFTQFIQQPTFTLVTIQTTVSVPDGGTVLLGGLKLLNEGRNEFGPPILSKIPYLSRLWKNVGYGRDTSSLLIMVTPRIIINEEEEELQTGVNTRALQGQGQ